MLPRELHDDKEETHEVLVCQEIHQRFQIRHIRLSIRHAIRLRFKCTHDRLEACQPQSQILQWHAWDGCQRECLWPGVYSAAQND